MPAELYVIQVTLNTLVDNIPRARTFYIVTANGPMGALNAAFDRLAARVTANPEEKTKEITVTRVNDHNFILLDIKEQHTV